MQTIELSRPRAPVSAKLLALQNAVDAGGPPLSLLHSLSQLIEGLPEQIAILDHRWQIVAANQHWAAAVERHGRSQLRVGSNYKDACASLAAQGNQPALAVRDAIAQIETGARKAFRFVHEGEGAFEGHVFEVGLSRLRLRGCSVTVVARADITELCDLRRLRDGFSEILVQGQVEERRRMAREIHDSSMQLLTCMNFTLGRLKRPHRATETQAIIEDMERLVAEAQTELRTISYLAHPPLLADMGLPEALSTFVEGFGRRSGLNVSFQCGDDLAVQDDTVELALFRVIQEALANVHRHAHARTATVTLRRERGLVEAKVVDDGVGISATPALGVGLTGMRSRLEAIGGRLTIRAASPGTEVVANVPLPQHATA